jgi:6-pyruvoyltetrahydropterin/6-carboxytetrahydropterin synthase
MSASYHIRLALPRLVFSSGHFITYCGDVCERLHGHNYQVAAEIYGPLDENHYVVDFVATRDALQAIVDALDHRMLLPTGHPTIRVVEQPGPGGEPEVVVTHERRRWVFPRGDCVLLPVPNTTSELLARYIAGELQSALKRLMPAPPQRLVVEVDECHGQAGVCDLQCQ